MTPGAGGFCNHQGPRVLLVEGVSDCHVVAALAKHFDLPPDFGLYATGGHLQGILRLNALILGVDRVEVIGLLLDADHGAASRWNVLRQRLRHHPYPLPDMPPVGGLVLPAPDRRRPRLGVWLMPDNQGDGGLEDFCLQLADEPCRTVAEQAVALAEEEGVARFREPHRSKAVVHTYLAWQDEPGKPLGQSITSKALQPDHPIAQDFAEWLRRLFGDGERRPPR